MVGTQMNIFGIFIGYLLPTFFVDDYSPDDVLTPEKDEAYRSQIFSMLLFSSIVATVILIAVVLSFREQPGA